MIRPKCAARTRQEKMSDWKKNSLIAFSDEELQRCVEQEEKDLSSLQWSDKSLTLSKFIQKYTLPQIVRIEDGHYSQEEDSSLSSGQLLKIHCLKTVKKVSGIDQYGDEVHVPLNTTERIVLRPENHDQIYDTVSDLAHAKPLPKYVEVTRGYYDPAGLDGNTEEDLTVEPGERLEVLKQPPELFRFPKPGRQRFMVFKKSKGAELKLPFDSSPGFISLLDWDEQVLAEALHKRKLPFHASFAVEKSADSRPDQLERRLSRFGVIQLQRTYSEDLIVASCGYQDVRVIFTIPRDIDVTVRVAKGALTNDPLYTGLCQGYNNYKKIETLAIKRHEKDILRKSGEVRGYEYYLKSAEGGEFAGLEETAGPASDNEGDDEESSEEDEYVYSDKFVNTHSHVKVKKHSTMPYEITNIHVSDFQQGGKYAEHVAADTSEPQRRRGSFTFKSNGSKDKEPVKLIGIKPLNTSDRGKSGPGSEGTTRDILRAESNESGIQRAKSEEIDDGGYLVSVVVPEIPVEEYETSEYVMREKAVPTDNNKLEKAVPNHNKNKFDFNENAKKLGAAATMPSSTTNPKPPTSPKPPPKSAKPKWLCADSTADSTSFEIPKDLTPLSAADVGKCLLKLNLGHHVASFRENQINGELLMSLEENDFVDLKLSNFERKKLVKFVAGWRPDNC